MPNIKPMVSARPLCPVLLENLESSGHDKQGSELQQREFFTEKDEKEKYY